jgi:catechol 2,3-dioxygenase-like lactoylglutathione lyase family enzyme
MSSMFAYICLGTNDLERSARFYDATLGTLGYRRCDTTGESETSWNGWLGWGLYEQDGAVQDALWICKPYNGQPASVAS